MKFSEARLKRWGRWLGRAILVLITPLTFGELMLHVAPELMPIGLRVLLDFHQNYTTPDPVRGWRGIPNQSITVDSHPEYLAHIKLNSLGYRTTLTNGKVYSLVVGDSMTFGTGVEVEQIFTQQLERLVGQPVVNMAIGGYGPTQYTLTLQIDGIHFQPDVVIYAVNGDDIADVGTFEEWYANYKIIPKFNHN
jgi:hypothetical protein